jgi:hypothetical protein
LLTYPKLGGWQLGLLIKLQLAHPQRRHSSQDSVKLFFSVPLDLGTFSE